MVPIRLFTGAFNVVSADNRASKSQVGSTFIWLHLRLLFSLTWLWNSCRCDRNFQHHYCFMRVRTYISCPLSPGRCGFSTIRKSCLILLKHCAKIPTIRCSLKPGTSSLVGYHGRKSLSISLTLVIFWSSLKDVLQHDSRKGLVISYQSTIYLAAFLSAAFLIRSPVYRCFCNYPCCCRWH